MNLSKKKKKTQVNNHIPQTNISCAYMHVHCSRDDKENQAISKNQSNKLRTGVSREQQFPSRQAKNDPVEHHRVDERNGEDVVAS